MDSFIQHFMPLWKDCRLGSHLGNGSFGEVWELISNENGEECTEAVKEVIIPSLSANGLDGARMQGLDKTGANYYFQGMLRRALDEVELMQELADCKHIVHFIDCQQRSLDEFDDEIGWVLFIRMEKLISLEKFLLIKGITIYEVIKLGMDICDAVNECDKHGILHRDIKPENIFYSEKDQCFKLGDFGISIHISRPTEGKGLPGTLTHMSPEVFKGQTFTNMGDLYALGMVLYKILNDNRIPFLPKYPEYYLPEDRDRALGKRLDGAEIELPSIVYHKKSSQHSTLFVQDNDMPIAFELAKIVTKAIAADPKQRYQTAIELGCALNKLYALYERKVSENTN